MRFFMLRGLGHLPISATYRVIAPYAGYRFNNAAFTRKIIFVRLAAFATPVCISDFRKPYEFNTTHP